MQKAEQQDCQHAATVERHTYCLLSHPGALGILILPLYDEQEMRKQSWGGKSSRRWWKQLIFPPLYGEAVFQFGKLKGNARDQCQRGPQLPISLCLVWQMFMLLTEVSDIGTLLQMSSRNRTNKWNWASVNYHVSILSLTHVKGKKKNPQTKYFELPWTSCAVTWWVCTNKKPYEEWMMPEHFKWTKKVSLEGTKNHGSQVDAATEP